MSFTRLADKKPKVVERWLRMRYGKKIATIARLAIKVKYNIIYSYSDRKRRKALDSTIGSLEKLILRCERNQCPNTRKIAECCLFMIIPLKDIETVKMKAALSSDEWERKLALRIIVLTSYEWDTRNVFNKSFYESLEAIGARGATADSLSRQVREFRRQQEYFNKKYGEIRNKLIAHRHEDSYYYLRKIRSMSELQTMEDASKLTEKINQ